MGVCPGDVTAAWGGCMAPRPGGEAENTDPDRRLVWAVAG